MPGTVKKDLSLAKSLGALNDMAELPAKFKNTSAKLLVRTADKIIKEAEHHDMLHDEERAYVLFMKYFNVVTCIKKSAEYKKSKEYYDNLIGSKNLVTTLDKAETLSTSLKERYDLLEAESVAKKLEVLDRDPKKDVKVDDKVDKEKTEEIAEIPKEEEQKKEEGVISCTQLYCLIEDRDSQLIIMDVRSIAEYQESRINHKNVINVPSEAVKPGTTVTYIEKSLPMDSLSLWKQRGNIDHIVLLDWNTYYERVKIGSTLQTLKDALFKYDSTVIIKSEPLILDGGYEQWLLHYPTKCLNPDFKKLSQPAVITSQGSLLDFDYPDFDETFLQPKPAQNSTGTSSNKDTSLRNGTLNGDSSVNSSMPKVDRSTKPKVDRSTKNNLNVTKIDVKSSNTGSLYPDVKSAAGPITNYGKGSSYADTRDKDSFNSAGSRAVINNTVHDGKKSSDNLNSELDELDRLKKQKQEELAEIQRKHEEMIKDAEEKMKKLRMEEEQLSNLESMRKKQQTDVADLMRMKRNLQESIANEKQRAQSENEKKEKEEEDRKRELDQIENEKKRREEEVSKLRIERKKKEEDLDRIEIERQEKAVQEARERSRQEKEREKRELEAAEERARLLRIEEEQREAARIKDEAERKKREKELQERLEREKEDRRRQLEMEKQLQERIVREEQERKLKEEKEKLERLEKERLEREEKERKEKIEKEEHERKRAEEAKRIADEKIRLMNEAARATSKLIPSPNLQVGWEKKLDSRTNRYFYVNHNDGTTQWEPPQTQGKPTSGTYTTKLKEEPKETRRGLSRSNSSPNIAQMLDDEPIGKKMPVIDRGNKPIMKRPEPLQRPVQMPAKRRDLNPVYGNVGRALTGLRNLGNTCYMNSTIQCLNNTSPLVTYLLSDMYLYDVNKESPLGNNGEVADDLAYVVKALWSGQYRFISPRDFKHVVGKHQPMFSGYDQQDSQEFLTFLLDGLHEGLNKVKTRPKIPEQDNDKLRDDVAAELAWKNHKLQNESIIVELFQGQLKSTIMCLTCRKQSVTFQAFMFLSLPIPSASRCTLQVVKTKPACTYVQTDLSLYHLIFLFKPEEVKNNVLKVKDCLRQFSAEEKMTGSSRWKCPACKCYRDSVKKIEIWKVPRILLIALNRFVYEGQWRTKINAFVDFPIRDLSLTSHVKGPSPRPYKLYAVSNHFGTLDGGHYTACCRNPCNQKWYKYDDHEVYDINESSIKTSAAYVLYYTSIELPPPDFRPNFR